MSETTIKSELWSSDYRFGLRLSKKAISTMITLCLEADNKETGGILVGRYTENNRCAEVTEASELPSDSGGGYSWLYRGISGLGSWLRNIWLKRREYYLGEWHYHPSGIPIMSQVDRDTMHRLASHKSLCPEPVLIIIGIKDNQVLIGVTVFTHKKEIVPLGINVVLATL